MGRKRLFSDNEVLVALERWFVAHDRAPTVEEFADHLGVSSTRTAQRYLKELEATGAIDRKSGSRGIRLLRRSGDEGVRTRAVPLVGEAPAGSPVLAEENVEAQLRLPRDLLRPESATHFLLRVRGDSMNESHVEGGSIESGDLVLVRQQATAEHRDVVVAMIDGEATIKRLIRGSGCWMLRPESTSEEHRPILVTTDFKILGVVTRVLKDAGALLEDLHSG